MKTDHLLILRFSAIGDVAMMVPVVYALAHQYPHLRITVVSQPFAKGFFESLAPNVNFMGADVKKRYHSIHGLNVLYRRLTAKNFTAVADFHDVLRTQYLRLRFCFDHFHVAHINKHRWQKHQLTRRKHKVLRQLPTSFQNYADVLAELGYPVDIQFHSIFPPEGGDLSLLKGRIEPRQGHEPWIGIAPFAAHEGKVYPMEKLQSALTNLIDRHPDCRLFLFGGGPQELEKMNLLAAKYPHCTVVASLLKGMYEELVLMSHLDVMVSMDSANMHLASLVGTRVVSVWGATHPFAGFMGWNQRAEDAVQIPLKCRPCSIYGNKPCFRGDYACLNELSPSLLVTQVERALSDKREPEKPC